MNENARPAHAAPTSAAPLSPLPLSSLSLAASDSRSMRMAARRRERQQRWMQRSAAEDGASSSTPSRRSEFVELELARAREQRRRQEGRVFAQLRSLQASSEQLAALKDQQRGTSEQPGGVAADDALVDHRLMLPPRSLGQADGQLLDLGLGRVAFNKHGDDGLLLDLHMLGLGQRHHIRRWLVEQNRVTQVVSLIEKAPPQARHALTALLELLLCSEPDRSLGGALRLRLGEPGDETEVVALEMDPPSPAPLKLELTPSALRSRESRARALPSTDIEEADAPQISNGTDDGSDDKRAGGTDQGVVI